MKNNINEKYKDNKYINDENIKSVVKEIIDSKPNKYYDPNIKDCVVNYNNIIHDNDKFLCSDRNIKNCYIKIDFEDNKNKEKKKNQIKYKNQDFKPKKKKKNLNLNKKKKKEKNKKLINIKDNADENLAGDNLNIKNNFIEEDLKKINDIINELNNTNIKNEDKDKIINIIKDFKKILLRDNIFLKSYDNQNQNEIRNIINNINNINI